MKNFIRRKENFVCDPPSHKASEGRRNFVRRIENFICEHCGCKVKGDGYTDHCPKCLWGKHVDKEIPGDRASECRGGMEPVGAEFKHDKFKIKYKCLKCGHIFNVREGEGDNRKILAELCGT